MASKEKKGGFLRWPWNLVIYVLLAAALRLFAVPVILALLYIQEKNNPHGQAEGCCLSRTRKRLTWLIWALLVLAVGGALVYMLPVGLRQDRTYWDTMDYVTLALCGAGGPLLLTGGLYLAYTAVRDAFFPAKSALAQSIRSQLPYPDEAPPVEELFAMVDGDLMDHAQWFGPVGIGQTWVLGDSVNKIDRIRGIFVVNELHQHHTQTGVRTSRNMELVLIDDRWQRTVTSFKSLKDLQAAAECLRLRVPEAAWGANSQNMDFWTMDESRREAFERDFRQRQSRRASERTQQELLSDGPQDMILKRRDGQVTSRVSAALVAELLRSCLAGEESGFELTPTRPVAGGGRTFRSLDCLVQKDAADERKILLLLELAPNGTEQNLALALTTDARQAEDILRAWLRREAPDLSGWELRRVYGVSNQAKPQARRQTAPDELALLYASGAAERHAAFTGEDVQIAAEGLVDGTYQKVRLSLGKKFLWMEIETGDKSDARCTVRAARPDPDKLRFFEARTSPRQAAAWLTAYYSGSFLPAGPDWRDYTKQVEKQK